MKLWGDFLGELCGTLIGTLDGDDGDFLFEELSNVIAEGDDLVEFVGGGSNIGSDGEGSDEVKGTVITDFTVGGKLGKLRLGGHGHHP